MAPPHLPPAPNVGGGGGGVDAATGGIHYHQQYSPSMLGISRLPHQSGGGPSIGINYNSPTPLYHPQAGHSVGTSYAAQMSLHTASPATAMFTGSTPYCRSVYAATTYAFTPANHFQYLYQTWEMCRVGDRPKWIKGLYYSKRHTYSNC